MSGLLSGRTAVVTGANRGLGAAVTKLFAKQGAEVWACARTPSAKFEETCAALARDNGVPVRPLYFDLAKPDQIAAGVKVITEAKSPADILVNNAGQPHGGLFQMTPVRDIRRNFEINYFGPLELTQRLVRLMARRKKGSIVNVASASGLDGRAGNAAYGAGKAALILATRSLAQELAPQGLRVNAVAPGAMATDMLEAMDPKAREELIASTAFRRSGQPEEVAEAVLFLASDKAAYITGQVLRVDGGL